MEHIINFLVGEGYEVNVGWKEKERKKLQVKQ